MNQDFQMEKIVYMEKYRKENKHMKTIKFTNAEIESLKDALNSYISYMLASGVSEDYIEVRACKSFIEKLEK